MASPSSFFLSWWYSPTTKLGIYFNSFSLNAKNSILTAAADSGLDSTNGMGASVQEDYHYENMITSHPVENSPAISDHIIVQPTLITVTGLITSIVPLPLSGVISFSQLGNATQLLVEMSKSRTGLTLQTGLLFGQKYARFDNLAVQSLDIPRNNEYGRSSIKFTIVFKQLLITSANATLTPQSFSQAVQNDGGALT